MADPGGRRSAPRRKIPAPRRAWCCSLGGVELQSPDRRSSLPPSKQKHSQLAGSFNSSPSPSSKLSRGIIDARRILSPGRVSPIDSDAPLDPVPEIAASANLESEPESPDPTPEENSLVPVSDTGVGVCSMAKALDLRLRLRGKDGGCLVLELDPEVLCENSSFFAATVRDSNRTVSGVLADREEVEVADVRDLGVFRETLELMYEKDPMRWLMKAGVSRAINILEVSSTIMFDRGVASCLNYLEAVPWSESEEEKLKSMFARCAFDKGTSQDVLARLGHQDSTNSGDFLAVRLIQSVANGANNNARKEMQSLVNGLLSKSSIYEKDLAGLSKERLYCIAHSCLDSLVELFEEASDSAAPSDRKKGEKIPPLIERISKQVENLNWLLEILIYNEMAEDFVSLWAKQDGLIRMHGRSSPMVRYELSRTSASVFVAMGKGKLQCRGVTRLGVLRAWFGPMLADFGWLRRCSKGLDMRMVEESLGQALLTLPLKHQQGFFEEWFRSFAVQGTECPNLSKAFQVWWRRSFVRSTPSEAL